VTLDTTLALTDLRDAVADLEAARGSPKQVRRAFTQVVDLSQKLTSAMRKDYSRVKGRNWEAKKFTGWSGVTEFFKWLRNHDQHSDAIYISVHERRFYENPRKPGELFPFEGTWALSDQMADGLALGQINFYPIDPATGEARSSAMPPVRTEYQYLFQPRSAEAKRKLRLVSTTDVHQLSMQCLGVLEQYYEFFLAAL
jgi:hypothetical protein